MFKKIIILARTIACLVCQVLLIRFKDHNGIIIHGAAVFYVLHTKICTYRTQV